MQLDVCQMRHLQMLLFLKKLHFANENGSQEISFTVGGKKKIGSCKENDIIISRDEN